MNHFLCRYRDYRGFTYVKGACSGRYTSEASSIYSHSDIQAGSGVDYSVSEVGH